MKSIILGVGVGSMITGIILLSFGNELGILLLTLGCLSAITNKQSDERQRRKQEIKKCNCKTQQESQVQTEEKSDNSNKQ